MPGIYFAGVPGGNLSVPDRETDVIANSINGAGTPPAAQILGGDLVVKTIKSTLTGTPLTPVVRMLLAADKTAHYKEGTPVAGIYGCAASGAASTSTGGPQSAALLYPANIPYPYTVPGTLGQDAATARGYVVTDVALPGKRFWGRLDMNATDWTGPTVTVGQQFNGLSGGFNISTVAGVTTYTLIPNSAAPGVAGGAVAADQCIILLAASVTDNLYNVPITVTGAVGAGARGPLFEFTFVPAFMQALTGVQYSTQ